jgi:hypothetical protein
VEDPFDFKALRIQQPPNRANYEIFNAQRQLLATATEADGHARLDLLSKSMPDTRVFAITTAAGEPAGSLVKQASQWITELRSPEGELIGRIRTRATRRIYTLLNAQDQPVATVTGDLALKHFFVTNPAGSQFALIRKTWAGLAKEMLTPSDHYAVEFTGPVSQPARTLTVMVPILLDLTLYGPV